MPSPCLAGFACPPAASAPALCPAGAFSLDNASACSPCALGAFVASQGATACLACANGTFSPATGATSCSVWPAAASASSFCSPGFRVVWVGSGYACVPCPAGMFCPDGAPTPLPCPIGFYCPTINLTFPVLCGGGQNYCPVSNLASPLPCPVGFVNAPGATVCATPIVSTLAGGSAGTNGSWTDGNGTAAGFFYPRGVVVDTSGNVFVADQNSHRVRRVTPSGGMRLAAQVPAHRRVEG